MEKTPAVGSEVELSESDSHHASKVLRLRATDLIEVSATDGSFAALAEIIDLENPLKARIREPLAINPSRGPNIVLLAPLLKGDKNELVCDWATELNVSSILFFQAERSVVRLKTAKDIAQREMRLQRRAQEAAKQCHRNSIPKLLLADELSTALKNLADEGEVTHKFFGSLSPEAKIIPEIRKTPPTLPKIALAIGPEGDLTAEEIDQLIKGGFTPFTLGDTVLRSELAIVASILNVRLACN